MNTSKLVLSVILISVMMTVSYSIFMNTLQYREYQTFTDNMNIIRNIMSTEQLEVNDFKVRYIGGEINIEDGTLSQQGVILKSNLSFELNKIDKVHLVDNNVINEYTVQGLYELIIMLGEMREVVYIVE